MAVMLHLVFAANVCALQLRICHARVAAFTGNRLPTYRYRPSETDRHTGKAITWAASTPERGHLAAAPRTALRRVYNDIQ